MVTLVFFALDAIVLHAYGNLGGTGMLGINAGVADVHVDWI
jgi:hypothetical protein